MDHLGLTYILIGAVAALCMLPFVVALRAKSTNIFEPACWAAAYFALLFVLRPIYDLVLGSEFLGSLPFDKATGQAFNLALVYASLSFCAFLAGYYSKLGGRFANRLPALPTEWDENRVKLAWPVLLGLGVMSLFGLVNSFGGLTYYLCNKAETLTAPGQGYLLLGVSLISVAFALKLTHSLAARKRDYISLGLLLMGLLIIGFASGSKGAFLVPVLVAMVAIRYLKGGIRFRHIVGLVLVVFLLFPIFNTYRHYSCSAQSQVEPPPKAKATQQNEAILEVQATIESLARHGMSRFYGIDSLTLVIRDTPQVMDYQHGKTVLPLLVAWVPRQIWEDKPTISFGKVFAETYLGKYFAGTGISASPTMLGEAYLNWHLPGMLLVALLAGVLIRFVHVWLIERSFGAPAVFIYSQFFLYLFTFWEASIAGLLAERIATLIILLAMVFTTGKRTVTGHPMKRGAT